MPPHLLEGGGSGPNIEGGQLCKLTPKGQIYKLTEGKRIVTSGTPGRLLRLCCQGAEWLQGQLGSTNMKTSRRVSKKCCVSPPNERLLCTPSINQAFFYRPGGLYPCTSGSHNSRGSVLPYKRSSAFGPPDLPAFWSKIGKDPRSF